MNPTIKDLAQELDIEVELEFEKIKKEMDEFWREIRQQEFEEDGD